MADLLPVGALVDVHERATGLRYVATVIGYDMFHSKYHVSRRHVGWGEYVWSDGGYWPFPDEVAPYRNEVA